MNAARVLVAETHEIHMIHAQDTAYHQLDHYCACDPDIYLVGMTWARIDHLHYGPKQEFESEEPS